MKVKGTAVRTIIDYVKKNYPDQLTSWLEKLPEESKEIMSRPIMATSWYSMKDAAIIPTRKISDMFFDDYKKGAWETGMYSAEVGLKGIYKIFVKASSPSYIIQRASKILPTYYDPSEMKVISASSKSVTLHITSFPEPDKTIEYRIGGWIQRALEISNCKEVTVKITKSLTRNDEVTEFSINWN